MQQPFDFKPPGSGPGGLEPLSGIPQPSDDTSAAFWTVILVALGLAVGFLLLIAFIKSFVQIARPNEALVFTGKASTLANGQQLRYSVLQQGQRGIRIPIIHKVDRLDMRLLPVDIVVQNAYSAGNIPLQIHAVANVKIHPDGAYLHNAIERFLGRNLHEVQTVAQQTLEGAVREVIATLTPEQVNEDRLAFAEQLSRAAVDDLNKLGLKLDTLKIQTVSDETGYLDSLGRPRIAAGLRDAENAENTAAREIAQAQATSTRRAESSKAVAEANILEMKNELRRVNATLEGEAQAIEREAQAAAKAARAVAEKNLQSLRATLEQKRLQADVVIPANFKREARAILAVGEAAPTAENGAAAAKVLELMGEAWRSMGPQAKEIYVIQHLEQIVGSVVEQLRGVEVDEVAVLDQGDGEGLAAYAATYPKMVASVLAAVSESTGVDVPAILAGGESKRIGAGGV